MGPLGKAKISDVVASSLLSASLNAIENASSGHLRVQRLEQLGKVNYTAALALVVWYRAAAGKDLLIHRHLAMRELPVAVHLVQLVVIAAHCGQFGLTALDVEID
jgi:hypothetical protein